MASGKLTLLLALAAGIGVSGCAENGYGYGGASLGYASDYYGSGYGYGYSPGYYGGAGYGWYGDYYYPGNGYYVYDRGGRRSRWTGDQQRYWQNHGYAQRNGEARGNWRNYRRDGQQQGQAVNEAPRAARGTYRGGAVAQDPSRVQRQERPSFRQEPRGDRPSFRRGSNERPH